MAGFWVEFAGLDFNAPPGAPSVLIDIFVACSGG